MLSSPKFKINSISSSKFSPSFLHLFFTLIIILAIFGSSKASPNRRPIQITPFLYSDAVNIGSGNGENLPSARRAIFSRSRQFMPEESSIDGGSVSSSNGRIMQISPFFYSSSKRD